MLRAVPALRVPGHGVTVPAMQVSSVDLQQPAPGEAQASQQPGPSSPPTQPSDSGPAAPHGARPAGASQERRASDQAAAAEAALSAGPGPAGPRRKAAADDSLQHPGGRHLRATLQRPSARMLFALTSRKDRHQPVLTSWEEAIAQVCGLPLKAWPCRLPGGEVGPSGGGPAAHHWYPILYAFTVSSLHDPRRWGTPSSTCAVCCWASCAAGWPVCTSAHWCSPVLFYLA